MKMGMKLLRVLGAVGLAVVCLLSFAKPVYAISLPDSTPTIISKYAYRNVLETGDFFLMIYENTPYTTPPSTNYSDAFLWRFLDTDGSTELAQAVGYDLNENGYGYNVISFYFSAAGAPTWHPIADNYYLKLSGSPVAFAAAPEYTYTIETSDYSSLTDTNEVKSAIAAQILIFAQDLNNKWGLSTDYFLTLEIETGTVLSMYGEALFRGAIYGVQAIAPAAFRLVTGSVDTADRTWANTYATALKNQLDGTYLKPAMDAGNDLLGVDYNLFGMLGALFVCLLLLISNWVISGGNIWKGVVEASSPLVITARMGLFGLGELGLIAACCWLYVSAKVWKVI